MRDDGFTLVEVLVALVVASVLVLVLIDGAGSARSREHSASLRARALIVGRTELITELASPFNADPSSGKINGFDWKETQDILLSDVGKSYALVHIRVIVSYGRGKPILQLDGRRLKRIPR